MVTLAKRIKRIRIQYNLTHEEMAKMLCTSRMNVYRWEKGVTKPIEGMAFLALERIEEILQENNPIQNG